MPTNIVTPFSPGETITVTLTETIFHPGHYRVVLSTTGQSGLPADPPVTPLNSDPCASTVIQNPPVFPVLADGQLIHTSAFAGPQSFQVTLPSDVTCTNCTLQIAQFMSSHALNNPGGCFYHHCANISIQATGTGGTGGGTGGGGAGGGVGGGAGGVGDGGPGGGADDGSGCDCSTGRPGSSPIAVGCLLALLVLAVRRRRP
jgi:MYXO-CTERM domain-containing protein